MRDQWEGRLAELRSEYAAGEKAVADLESKLTEVRGTMERIRGAIQVIEDLLAKETSGSSQ